MARPVTRGGARALSRSSEIGLRVDLLWVGTRGERAEYCLDREGLVRVRVAREQCAAQPIFALTHETRIEASRLPALARAIERSGVFTLSERVEDLEGRAGSLRLVVELRGRRLELWCRRERAPAIDRLVEILDQELAVHAFASLPEGPAARGRARLQVDLERALRMHRDWARQEPGRRTLLLDQWLLARRAGEYRTAAELSVQIDRDPELARFRDACAASPAAPIR